MAKKEEQVKLEVAKKLFTDFDCTQILGNVDFCVSVRYKNDDLYPHVHNFLWAEAKNGTKHNIYDSFVQLIFTIGKERTFEHHEPPVFLGAFDEEKIAFIPYNKIQEVFFQTDFDWTEAPSNHDSKEFKQLKELVRKELDGGVEVYQFHYLDASKDVEKFIKKNFKVGKRNVEGLQITKNNFTFIYAKWCKHVRPSISVNWDGLKKNGILDAYFFLADILSEQNKGIFEKLHVLLQIDHYDLDRQIADEGLFSSKKATFNDGMKAHTIFWNQYKRPPRKEFWEYFIERVDLLVPQDIRERKGSYFTPQIWVEKSQEYLSDVLGEDWQEEYYIWDCCAGTGNMEVGLKNKYRVWASTLDIADVRIMQERITNGANLLQKHVFQFDFLNDSFDDPKVPSDLRDVLNNEEKRKKLIIYINPPYAEAGNRKTLSGSGTPTTGVSVSQLTYKKYVNELGVAGRELFVQFFIRIYHEIPDVILAEFSKLKILQSSNFVSFRSTFKAKLEKLFIVPANTFDNVRGQFPIGFFIWDTSDRNKQFENIQADVFNSKGDYIGQKKVFVEREFRSINDWIKQTRNRPKEQKLAWMSARGCDMQVQAYNFITNNTSKIPHPRGSWITDKNLIEGAVYLSVYQCVDHTWLNDRDQFFFPNNNWKHDKQFQNDCLAYTLFHGQNRINSADGVNHWIPFTEEEVDAQMAFESHFMSDYIKGKIIPEQTSIDLFPAVEEFPTGKIQFSKLAQDVMDAGRELWKYYHSMLGANPNASFYDIRAYFQGVNEDGKMKIDSGDKHYTELIKDLRNKQKKLAKQIEEKVYEYGFLK